MERLRTCDLFHLNVTKSNISLDRETYETLPNPFPLFLPDASNLRNVRECSWSV